jgi:hypothetical protein
MMFKIKLLLSVLFTGVSLSLLAQSEKINQLDAKGKKDGKWIEYIDEKFRIIKDSSKAVFCAYNNYDHGENIYTISFGNISGIAYKMEHTANSGSSTGKINMLDGEYKWFDKKGRIVVIDSFKNGEHIASKYYAWRVWDSWLGRPLGFRNKLTGKLHEDYDFTKTYMSQPYTYHVDAFETNGKVFHAYMRKGQYGWAVYEE